MEYLKSRERIQKELCCSNTHSIKQNFNINFFTSYTFHTKKSNLLFSIINNYKLEEKETFIQGTSIIFHKVKL